MSIEYIQKRQLWTNIAHNKSSPLRRGRSDERSPGRAGNNSPQRYSYKPLNMNLQESFNARLDLEDRKKRISDLIEADR